MNAKIAGDFQIDVINRNLARASYILEGQSYVRSLYFQCCFSFSCTDELLNVLRLVKADLL